MKFAIRDDDVNFYTTPEELAYAYGSTWDVCPPTLCAITHVKGNWKYWTEEIYRSRHNIDWDSWQQDNKAFPMADNTGLITFLKEKIKERKMDIALHAIHHRNDDPVPPGHKSNNYVLGAEFYTTRDQSGKIKNGIEYLTSLLNTSITVFTPPQNLLSEIGYKAVLKNKLSIVGAGISFWKKEKTIRGLTNVLRVLAHKFRFPATDYPYLLNFTDHSEIIHHYPLHPTTRLENLVSSFEHVRKFNGVFVLSTHYHEFSTPLTYDSGQRMRDVFNEFMQYVGRASDVQYSSLSDLFRIHHNKYK